MESGSFTGTLFDLSFSRYVFPRVVRGLYLLALVLAGAVALGMVLAGLRTGGEGIVSVLFAPVVFLLIAVYSRAFLELMVVMFRIAEDVRRIAEFCESESRDASRSTSGSGNPRGRVGGTLFAGLEPGVSREEQQPQGGEGGVGGDPAHGGP